MRIDNPALGTPASGVLTNCTGTATVLTAGAAANVSGGAASNVVYQSATNATAFVANGTAGQVLTSAGSGAPVWAGISGGTF